MFCGLAIVALTTCGVAWLSSAGLLTLDLLGRLPGARNRNARAFRLIQTAMLVLMTMLLLQQVSSLAHWARPIRGAILILSFPAAIGAMAAVIKAATIMSKAKQDPGSLGYEQPAWHDWPSG